MNWDQRHLLLSTAGLLVAGLAIYAWRVEPHRRALQQTSVPLDRLPVALDGRTILHLSDLHLRVGDEETAGWLRGLHRLDPDLVVVTGDLIESDADALFCAATLGLLRGRYGTFAVLGNHDHGGESGLLDVVLRRRRRNDVVRLVRALAEQGVETLVNEGRVLQIDGGEIWVGGVDDPHGHRADAARALEGDRHDRCRLLLAHSPDILAQPAAHTADLVLAGHTHGGQIVLPFVGAPVTRTRGRIRPAAGWFRLSRGWLHVSRGVGQTVPIRFGCRPEATLITLRAVATTAARTSASATPTRLIPSGRR